VIYVSFVFSLSRVLPLCLSSSIPVMPLQCDLECSLVDEPDPLARSNGSIVIVVVSSERFPSLV